ncbi:MAG: Zn-ribbon domain-containing protein [Haloferacaceae archaeon]
MPHQCTNCGRRFPDGSKEMLSGCPDCGGNKFQFQPGDRDSDGSSSDSATSSEPSDSTPASDTLTPSDPTTDADGDPFSWPGHDDPDEADDADIIEPDPDPPTATGPEDGAQADARTEVASPDELADSAPVDEGADADVVDDVGTPDPDASGPSSSDATVAATPDEDAPDLTDLRQELNDQFESIRVLNPGQYELNLMELYDREEYIISLREDGRYVIEVPEAWRRSDPE